MMNSQYLERLLWLILKSNEGYTLERPELEDYPGDDRAAIQTREDIATGALNIQALTRPKHGD